MLLGDADVERALREALGEQVQAGAGRHGGGDGDDPVVPLGLLDQFLGEDLGVLRRRRLALGLLAGDDIELGHGVQLVGGALGGRVALALLRHHMDQDRLVLDLTDIFQDRHQGVEVVTIDRADIVEAKFLEQRTAGHHAPGIFLGLASSFLQRLGQHLGDRLADLAQRLISAAGNQAGHIGAHPADRRGYRHVVVVEDDGQLAGRLAGVVHGLIGHAGAHRAVADHRDHAVVLAVRVAGRGETEGRGNRGRRVGRAERVVFALAALGEAGEAAALA